MRENRFGLKNFAEWGKEALLKRRAKCYRIRKNAEWRSEAYSAMVEIEVINRELAYRRTA